MITRVSLVRCVTSKVVASNVLSASLFWITRIAPLAPLVARLGRFGGLSFGVALVFPLARVVVPLGIRWSSTARPGPSCPRCSPRAARRIPRGSSTRARPSSGWRRTATARRGSGARRTRRQRRSRAYNYFLTKKVIFSYTSTYYIIETFVYFYNKEYIFIPHHFCTLGMLYFFYNFPFHLLKPVLLGMGIIEKSGAITDYRDILKHDNQLTLFYDVSFLLYYISIRQFYFAYHIYYDYPLDTIEQKINVFFLSLLYIMSFYWSIIWTKSIIKYNKLFKND